MDDILLMKRINQTVGEVLGMIVDAIEHSEPSVSSQDAKVFAASVCAKSFVLTCIAVRGLEGAALEEIVAHIESYPWGDAVRSCARDGALVQAVR